ncbi:MAG: glyceraldehyde-3-phosphate dehydrogenase [Alphaproteobacteria bacterium]|nr:glyceraldehyde-3-phosphate dehydrogenase [Alphaproteobacteria bacterium]
MTPATTLATWNDALEQAERIVPIVGQLYRDFGVMVLVHGTRLVNESPVAIVRAHRRGHTAFGHDVRLAHTREALETVLALQLAPVTLDVGRLLTARAAQAPEASVASWITERCGDLPRLEGGLPPGRDVVLYGFGRIGRILARQLVERAGGGEKYNLRAVVIRGRGPDDLERRANLLRNDSVHGAFDGTVVSLPDEQAWLINGTKVQVITADAPDEVDYTAYGISDAVVIDNTGKWRDREGLSRHLKAPGVSRVILTAPGKGDVPNIVHGINDADLSADERVVSAASCTTNAIVPVLKAVHDRYGIVSGHIETVHAYTNDQNLLDNYHKANRRGRSAPLNLVITDTGAAKAAAKALPFLEGRLTANAIRVPTPNVSLAILHLRVDKPVDREGLNAFLYETAVASPLQEQIGWTSNPDTVSSDLVGSMHAGVVDGAATIAHDDEAVLYVWYDNEHGYCAQVMRLLGHVAGRVRPAFP